MKNCGIVENVIFEAQEHEQKIVSNCSYSYVKLSFPFRDAHWQLILETWMACMMISMNTDFHGGRSTQCK